MAELADATDSKSVALIPDAIDFVKKAQANHTKPLPVFIGGPLSNRELLSWLIKHQQPLAISSPANISPRVESISSVFAERFILIEPTGGDENAHKSARTLSDDFQNAWKRTNYVSCRVVRDIDFKSEEEQNSNLILLGNAQTNTVWKRFAPKLPVKVEKDRVAINDQSWTGDNLCLQAWFRHPEMRERKIALIGGWEPKNWAFGTLELCLEGWFDYAIWRKNKSGPELVAAENY